MRVVAVTGAMAFVYFSCSDYRLRQDIRNYKGDGKITYLPAQWIFGGSGVAVEMPHLDISKGFTAHYDLTNLPKTRGPYVIYLVSGSSSFITPGNTYRIEIFRNGASQSVFSVPPLRIVDTELGRVPRMHHQYFDRGTISPTRSQENWTVNVSYSGVPVPTPVEGYVLVEATNHAE